MGALMHIAELMVANPNCYTVTIDFPDGEYSNLCGYCFLHPEGRSKFIRNCTFEGIV